MSLNSKQVLFIRSSPLSILERSSMVFTRRESRFTSSETNFQIIILFIGRDRAVQNPVDKAGDGSHGGFQLVGNISDEAPRVPSEEDSEAAMLLNATASSPISSSLVTGTRREKSPDPKHRAASAISRKGLTIL